MNPLTHARSDILTTFTHIAKLEVRSKVKVFMRCKILPVYIQNNLPDSCSIDSAQSQFSSVNGSKDPYAVDVSVKCSLTNPLTHTTLSHFRGVQVPSGSGEWRRRVLERQRRRVGVARGEEHIGGVCLLEGAGMYVTHMRDTLYFKGIVSVDSHCTMSLLVLSITSTLQTSKSYEQQLLESVTVLSIQCITSVECFRCLYANILSIHLHHGGSCSADTHRVHMDAVRLDSLCATESAL